MTAVYLKLTVSRTHGPAQPVAAVREALEAEIEGSFIASGEADYIVHVQAIGPSLRALQLSTQQRANRKGAT